MNIEETQQNIEIEPTSPAKKSVIWLHGLGADGSDFVPIVPELKLPSTSAIRFIFPHAPIMPVTVNNGYEMRAWFDVYDVAVAKRIDEAGIAQSVKTIGSLIEKEMARGITSENIILAGFSQGAVIALTLGLTYPQKLGGILALSGFLPHADKVLQLAAPANQHIPIFIAHGTEDPVLPYALGKSTYVDLEKAGYAVSWHSYAMPHSVCAEEIKDISHWLSERQ